MWNNFCMRTQPILRSFRRCYQYKPKDKNLTLIKSESSGEKFAASQDLLLFRYENPRRIMLYNFAGGSCLTMFSFMARNAWQLDKDFAKKEYKERMAKHKHGWLFEKTVLGANRFVSLAMFCFGAGLCFYWLVRNLYMCSGYSRPFYEGERF